MFVIIMIEHLNKFITRLFFTLLLPTWYYNVPLRFWICCSRSWVKICYLIYFNRLLSRKQHWRQHSGHSPLQCVKRLSRLTISLEWSLQVYDFFYLSAFTIQIYIFLNIIKNQIWTQLEVPLIRKRTFFDVVLLFLVCVSRMMYTYNVYAILQMYFSDRFINFIYSPCVESRSQSMSVCDLNHAIIKKRFKRNKHKHLPYKSGF